MEHGQGTLPTVSADRYYLCQTDGRGRKEIGITSILELPRMDHPTGGRGLLERTL